MKYPAMFLLAAVFLGGCVEQPSRLDEEFGSAVTRARAQQVIDPDAPSRQRAPLTVDGQAAKSAVDRYQKSFETPPPPVNVFTIGVGTDSGSSGSSGSTGSSR